MGKSLGTDIAKLLSSKVGAQAVTLATIPIIARLFSPDSFGVFQIFVSITSIITVIICLRYELSIPLGRSEDEAITSLVLSLFFAFVLSLVVLVVVPVGKEKVAQWFKTPGLAALLWILPAIVFVSGLRNILRYWAAREGRFGAMAWSDFSRVLVGTLVTISYVLVIGDSAAGLLIGYFAGVCLGVLLLLVCLSRKLISVLRNADLSFQNIWTLAKRHKNFPAFSTWSALLNTISVRLPAIILGLFFSTTVAGYYSLGQRVVGLPLSLVGASISQAFFPAGARKYNETGGLSTLVGSVFRRLVQIGVFPMLILIFLGPILSGFVLGQKWIEAGVYSQILAFWLLFAFMYSPLSTVFSILNRQGVELFFNGLITAGRVASLLIGATIWSPRGTLCIFVAVSVISVIALIFWMLRLSKVSILWASKTLLKYTVLCCILILPVRLVSPIVGDLGVVIGTIFATMLYVIALLRIEPALRQFILMIVARLRHSKASSLVES